MGTTGAIFGEAGGYDGKECTEGINGGGMRAFSSSIIRYVTTYMYINVGLEIAWVAAHLVLMFVELQLFDFLQFIVIGDDQVALINCLFRFLLWL